MKHLRYFSAILALVFVFSILTACSSGNGSTTSPVPSGPSASEEPTPSALPSDTSVTPENPLSEDEQYLAGVSYRHYELTGEETPYFMGRWFKKTIDEYPHMVTCNSGSMMYFMVKGAESIEVNFTLITGYEIPYYAYSIDGGAPVRRSITQTTVELPDTERHTVRIITEGIHENVGKWNDEKGYAFKNIVPSEGGQILGIKPKEKVVFFYGDSITEGVNAIGATGYGGSHSATNAYPWYCSEKLGVTLYNIGYGATGLINTGSFNTMIMAIDKMTTKRPVSMDITPDVIVINHGHNDQYYSGEQMKLALQKTISRLQNKYPNVPIVYMTPFNQAHASLIADYMSGVENSYVVLSRGWNISMTEGVHPNAAGAKKAGEKLADEMLKIFGEEYFESVD